MNRRSGIQTSTLIIILSMITILLQFLFYYLFDIALVIWGIACLASLLCCHLLLEQTTTYEACFDFSLLTLFISLIIIFITYMGDVQHFLPFSSAMLGIAIINWLIPMVYCFVRNMLDYGTRNEDFSLFYRNSNIIFLTIYISVMMFGVFSKDAFPFAYGVQLNRANFVPFELISIQIEDYLYDLIPLSDIILYLLFRILSFIPYGFYVSLLLRRQGRLLRFFAFLLLPFLIELLQYFMIPQRCDIDDLIYALIGGLIGAFLFFLQNVIHRTITGRNFLWDGGEHRFSNSSLHF